MGLQDRDYVRERPLPMSAGLRSPAVWWIIGINLVIWVFAAGSARSGESLGRFVYGQLTLIPERVWSGEVWRVFTAIWVHNWHGIGHVLLNMLLLFFLGRSVEGRLGSRGFVRLYVLAGLASTVFLALFYLATKRSFSAFGASGAVYGVVTWLATVEPRRVVFLFGVLAMPMWVLVGVFIVGLEVIGLGDAARPMEPILGHLAGAACGFVLARMGRTYEVPAAPRSPPPSRAAKPEPKADPAVRARVDALLKKIHDEGIASLSESEKQFLQDASERYR